LLEMDFSSHLTSRASTSMWNWFLLYQSTIVLY